MRTRTGIALPSLAHDRRARGQRSFWVVATTFVLAVGIAIAVFGARVVGAADLALRRESFTHVTGDHASEVGLALQRVRDLEITLETFFADHPRATNADLTAWVSRVDLVRRYPEVSGLGHVAFVPQARLASFLATLAAERPNGSNDRLTVSPPGTRSSYCLVDVAVLQGYVPARGTDYCIGALAKMLLTSRDTGRPAFAIIPKAALLMATPVYSGGAPPATTDARRAHIGGWTAVAITSTKLLPWSTHDAGVVTIRRRGMTEIVAQFGRAPNGPTWAQRLEVGDGWTLDAAMARPAESLVADRASLALLATGIAVSMLLAALVFVLGTGRARANVLVEERTDALRYQAMHDTLTGLPNRALVHDRIEQLLARTRRHGTTAAALYVDLDGFKTVNDRFGHELGDALLRLVSARLATTLREVDTVGRIGGDEFVVLVETSADGHDAVLVADRLLDVMRAPFELDGVAIAISASVGIAYGGDEGPAALLRDADVALYEAKAAGRNRYEHFRPHMQAALQDRLELELDLRFALEHGQFRLLYQPIYALDSMTLIGVEALIRWEHPTRGTVPPSEFVGTLERSGAIVEVGRWVLQTACEQLARWHAAGRRLDVAVNVSARQLDADSIVDDVRTALETSGLPPRSLVIEVTETSLMRDAEATGARLRALKALGVQIAIDDFGTGYSSLAYLRQFPVDTLKIDRAFTHAITDNAESRALMHTLVQLGKQLGLKTIAEGIESRAEVDYLQREACDEGQGFLFARPLDALTIETSLLGLQTTS